MVEIQCKFIPAGTGIRCPKQYSVLDPKGMCWHWTSNPKRGAGAENHWQYWHNTDVGAQYVVDDHTILQAAPDNEVVWHAGGGDYTAYAKKKYPAGCNSSLIGVEMCINSDGDWNETYRNAGHLGSVKCVQYGWSPYINFERHYDCTRKDCPRFWTPYVTGGNETWKQFVDDVSEEIKKLKGVETVETWKAAIMKQAAEQGLIDPKLGHQADDPATKWFVLAVGLNILKVVKGWLTQTR